MPVGCYKQMSAIKEGVIMRLQYIFMTPITYSGHWLLFKKSLSFSLVNLTLTLLLVRLTLVTRQAANYLFIRVTSLKFYHISFSFNSLLLFFPSYVYWDYKFLSYLQKIHSSLDFVQSILKIQTPIAEILYFNFALERIFLTELSIFHFQ